MRDIANEWIVTLLGLSIDEANELDAWIYDSCIDEHKFIEFIKEQTKELEKCVWELDLFSLLLEFIADDADVPELISYIYNHGSQVIFKISPSEAGKIMVQVPEEDRNEAWFFILDLIEVEFPDEEIDG